MITQRKSLGDTSNLWMSLHHGKKQHSTFQVKGLWIRKIASGVFFYTLYLSFFQEGDLGNRQTLGGRQSWGIVLVFLLWLKNGKDSGDNSFPTVINVAVLCTATSSSWPDLSSSCADEEDNSRTRVFGCLCPLTRFAFPAYSWSKQLPLLPISINGTVGDIIRSQKISEHWKLESLHLCLNFPKRSEATAKILSNGPP